MKKTVSLAVGVLWLFGCGVLPVSAQQSYSACIDAIVPQAAKAGLPADMVRRTLKGVEPDMSILELMDAQPEFKTPIWDYLASLADDERVDDGKAMLKKWGKVFQGVEKRFTVSRFVVAAVWGVESDFGDSMGTRQLIQSLATTSCYGRRRDYFRKELIAALTIVHNGDMASDEMYGSWAGAFGHTQFMPSTFQRLAVDMDGDGRRDIMNSVPDALGSTANFLRKAGWNNALPWGYEVRITPSFNPALAGRKAKRPLHEWRAMGVTHIDGSALKGDYSAAVLLPAGKGGPAFLVTKNFDALYSYNAAESYALAIGVLSDRLQGKPGIRAPWPTDDPPLSRAQRRELQRLLTFRGYDVGEIDGKIGAKTRAAIKEIERQLGMPQRGRAGGKVLDALR
ncbi:MAG: lytic murein transglycosylase [Methylobacteriaceae bacterium]|jgi:lytic murein transglycosylase|nr:lytic murein transglycosylase [Methylobacteriaceae bacterium]